MNDVILYEISYYGYLFNCPHCKSINNIEKIKKYEKDEHQEIVCWKCGRIIDIYYKPLILKK